MTSLYIHIPFCQRKCLYCSFTVYVGREKIFDTYLEALEKEAATHRGAMLSTVYVGGGTPSLLSQVQLERLVEIIRQNFDAGQVKEWTIEANPEDIDPAKANVFARLGFGRVSLGIQSFQEKYLRLLGRCHTAPKAREAFQTLRKAGISNINVDLMFGFPQQTEAELRNDLDAVVALGSEHVSIYSLTVEPLSRFYTQQIKGLDQDLQVKFYEQIVSRISAAGLKPYEISNFARPGRESIHNLNYWKGGNYIGLGVAAHSHKDGRRSWNVADLRKYLSCFENGPNPEEDFELLDPRQRLSETLAFGLRLNEGVDLEELERKFAVFLPAEKGEKIDEFIQAGFLKKTGQRISATSRGRLVLDELAVYLL